MRKLYGITFLILVLAVTMAWAGKDTPSGLTFYGESDKVVTRKQEKSTKKEKVEVSKQELDKNQVKKLSSNFLFSSATSGLKSLPGVVSMGDFNALLYVRGGQPYEVIQILDDYYLRNPYFFGGKISLINPKMVESIDFYTGGFPARYGNAMSGVIDVKEKTGSTKKSYFELDQNTTEFNYLMHGPIDVNRSSWLFSARRTYYDLIAAKLIGSPVVVPYFESYIVKLFFELTPEQKLYLKQSAYHDGADVSSTTSDTYGDKFKYNQVRYITQLKLESYWSRDLYSTASLGYEFSKINYRQTGDARVDVAVENKPVSAGLDLTSTGMSGHEIKTGFFMFREPSDQTIGFTELPNPTLPGSITRNVSEEFTLTGKYAGLYLQDEYTLLPRMLAINGGVRYEWLPMEGVSKSKSFEPRVKLYLGNRDETVFTFSYGKYSTLMTQGVSGNLVDLKPEQSYHYILGLEQNIQNRYKWKAEVFQKDYADLVESVRDSATDELLSYKNGKIGSATGLELYFQKKDAPDWDGWVSYTYSRVKYKESGKSWDYPLHDQRHTFNAVYTNHLARDWDLNAKWTIASGRPYTDLVSVSASPDARGIYVPVFEATNSSRMPLFDKLDLWFEHKQPVWPFDRMQGITYFGIANVLSHKNIDGYDWDKTYTRKKELVMMDGSMLPIFGTKIIF